MTTTTQKTTAYAMTDKDGFETQTCGRCHGSGHFSYCPGRGTVCFDCNGRKIVLSKRGAAARAHLEALRSKPVSELLPGEEIFARHTGKWHTVKRVQESGCARVVDGVHFPMIDVVCVDGQGLTVENLDSVVRVRTRGEAAAETLRQALAYQATLTKAGKPRAAR